MRRLICSMGVIMTENTYFTPEELAHMPRHIACIMDGNGRWAKQRGLPRTAGHKEGSETFRRAAEFMSDIGVQYFTVYAFSTENWKRPAEEVAVIMGLLEKYLRENKVYEFFTCIKDLSETWLDRENFGDFQLKLTDFIFEGDRAGNEVNAASVSLDEKKPLLGQKISLLLSKIFLPYRDLKKIYPALEKIPFMLPFFWIMRITGIIFRPEHRAFKRAENILSKTNKNSVEKTKEIFKHLGI